MNIGERIYTPRFCTVRIDAIFESLKEAYEQGYSEPTHYDDGQYEIQGKHIGTNLMVFAAIKRP